MTLHVNVKEVHNDDEKQNLDDEQNDRVDHLSDESFVQRGDGKLKATIVADDFLSPRRIEPSARSERRLRIRLWALCCAAISDSGR